MKPIIIAVLVLLLAASLPLAAQDEETLISGPVESGGFGGPSLRITKINGEVAVLVGGRGGWIINHVFMIGGAGYGLVTRTAAKTPGLLGEKDLDIGYGGLEMEYYSNPSDLVHLSVRLLLGGGGVAYREDVMVSSHRDMDGFFVAEPGISVNLNVTHFFRISAGASYRFVTGVDTPNDLLGHPAPLTSNADLSGPSALLTLKFGKF